MTKTEGLTRSAPPGPALMAASLVPMNWRVEQGYGEVVPNVGFRYVPYVPVPGGMTEPDALRMLHHYFTGSPDEWKGNQKGGKAQRAEVESEAVRRFREQMRRQGWQDVGILRDVRVPR